MSANERILLSEVLHEKAEAENPDAKKKVMVNDFSSR